MEGSEVRDGLIANGTMKAEEGTSTYTLLRRLAERGEIQKIGAAAYKSNPITDYSTILAERGMICKNRLGKYSFAVPRLGRFILRTYGPPNEPEQRA